MSIRAGQILHAMNRFVVDRLQTAGPGDLNIPTERIYELGNYQSVAVVRDIPDLTFSLDALDVGAEIEAALLNYESNDPDEPVPDWTEFTLADAENVDVVSPWKSRQNQFDVVRGVAIPHLTLESASYTYGLDDNASQSFQLRGDSVFYVPGSVTITEYEATADQTEFGFEYTSPTGNGPHVVQAIKYVEQGVDIFALNVSVNGERKFLDAEGDGNGDYVADANGVTFNEGLAAGDKVRIVFGFDPEELPGDVDEWPQSLHQGLGVRPAAIKGKDIVVFVAGVRWGGVQSVNAEYSVTLEDDFEFGNPRAVARDYSDVPDVNGSVELKPRSATALFERIAQITGVPIDEIVGPQSSVVLPVEIQLRNPDSGGTDRLGPGDVVKTLYIPDARFILPGYEGQVQQKLVTTLNYESDGGQLSVIKGGGNVEVVEGDEMFDDEGNSLGAAGPGDETTLTPANSSLTQRKLTAQAKAAA